MTTATPTRLSRGDAGVFLLAMLPWLVLEVAHAGWPTFPWQGDHAQYLLHAQALADGRPYVDTGYLFHQDAWPIGPRAYPPGLPLVLAPLVALGGVSSPLIRGWSLFAVALACWLAFLVLRRYTSPVRAALGAGFTAVAIEAVAGTRIPLSDPPFTACVWALLLIVPPDSRFSTPRAAGVAAILGVSLAFRQAGAALLLAFGLYLLMAWALRRPRAGAAVFASLIVAALAVWMIASPGIGILTAPGELRYWLGYIGGMYAQTLLETLLYPFGGNTVDDVYHVAGVLAAALGLVLLVAAARRHLLPWVLLCYGLMLAGVQVAEPRYLWPFFPLGAVALGMGLDAVWRLLRVPSAMAQRTTTGLLAAVLLLASARELRRKPPAFTYQTGDGAALVAALTSDAFRGARLVAPNPRLFTLMTGHPAMGPLGRTGAGQLAAWREAGITHIVWQRDDLSTCLQRVVNRVPLDFPAFAASVFENATFRVYRLSALPAITMSWDRINPGMSEPWCRANLPPASASR